MGNSPYRSHRQRSEDALDRLVGAQATGGPAPSYTQVYTYNTIGNLTGKSDVGLHTYPASGANSVRPHAVTATTSGWAFGYDANGNMTSRTVTEGTYLLSYTWENRLAAIAATTGLTVTRYVYDADGVLVKKTSGDRTTYYVNAGYEELRVGSFVTPTKTYTFGAQRVAMTVTGTLSYLYSDHLGSASLATDADGDVTAEMRYYPYGETRWVTGTLPTDRLFTGQRHEAELGLYDFVARRYDPRLGRFLQADTIVPEFRNPQSLNRYSHGYNNPIRYLDPSGHAPAWFDWAIGAVVQFSNNMLWGVPYLVYDMTLGPFWQATQSYAFQQGQQAGQTASRIVGTALAVDGVYRAATGSAAGPLTAGGTLATAPVTGGGSLVVGAAALTAEGAMVLVGGAETVYGVGILACASRNPAPSPSYRASNFRRNLENRGPKPAGMENPEAHHMLPASLRDRFGKLGVNVDDPRWGAWVEGAPPGVHQNWNSRYTEAWRQWLTANSEASADQIFWQAQQMAIEFGISWP